MNYFQIALQPKNLIYIYHFFYWKIHHHRMKFNKWSKQLAQRQTNK
jgi:hypothetical protein